MHVHAAISIFTCYSQHIPVHQVEETNVINIQKTQLN